MNREFIAILAISLITAMTAFFFSKPHPVRAAASPPPILDDGCVFSTKYCFVPFTRLINFPERYQGREIATIGFVDGASPVSPPHLYPGKEDVGMPQAEGEAIILNVWYGAPWLSDELKGKIQKGTWLLVQGVFDASAMARSGQALAVLHNIRVMEDATPRLPTVVIPPVPLLRHPAPMPDTPPQFEIAPLAH